MRADQLTVYFKRANQFLSHLREDGPLMATVPLSARCRLCPDPVPFSSRLNGEFREMKTGERWGETWESGWFHITGEIPEGWRGKDMVAKLDFNGESCVFDASGCPVCGLTSGTVFSNHYFKDVYPLPADSLATGKVDLWVEAAANGLFGLKIERDPPPFCPQRHGTHEGRIMAMELGLFDRETWGLLLDLEILTGLLETRAGQTGAIGSTLSWGTSKTLPELPPRTRRLLHGINHAIDLYAGRRENAAKARGALKPLLSKPANASDMRATAIGHAHIDTGWLWPVRETIRKCARTFSSQIALLEKYPHYVFGASQPQLYAFVKKHYPDLYEKIKQSVASGRWEPQGGMWVEADCNLISGESMVRQFLHGKNFFRDEFGVDVNHLWLPDVFGYSAALPQIMKRAGVDFFLTQKLSWSQFNQFPHSTFRWKGIDGSEVLVHFPPEDTYNSDMTSQGQVKAQNSFHQSHLLDEFICLFGIGNGGGGPKEEHVERALRMENLEGCPKVHFGRADEFFQRLASKAAELPTWEGELYLELHRATLTTQSRTKKGNRLLERKLREVEFIRSSYPLAEYPADELDRLWKTLLINQFHDILPGSSIHWVYETTEAEYRDALAACERLLHGPSPKTKGEGGNSLVLVNTHPRQFRGVVDLPESWRGCGVATETGETLPVHLDEAGTAVRVTIPPCGRLTIHKQGKAAPAEPTPGMVLENHLIRYEFDSNGNLVSAHDKEIGREMLSGKGNVFSLYVDRPVSWDAWDIDIQYENGWPETACGVEVSPLGSSAVRKGLRFRLAIGNSTITQVAYLESDGKRLDFHTHVDWSERHKMLRLSFPAAVQTAEATSDIQFGHISRPTHRNTGWDMAKFEVAAHKYVDLSNRDFGLALLNDSKYGHKVTGNVLDLNLLRSSTYPDPDADQGAHEFRYALLPHRGDLLHSRVIEEAEDLNFPPVPLDRPGAGFGPPVSVQGSGVSLAALKKAEKENALVLRLVESHGRHSQCELRLPEGSELAACDLMEWKDGPAARGQNHTLRFTPFEIKTLKIRNPAL